MKIVDCNKLVSSNYEKYSFDFCIIGAGIAGVILADQLLDKFNIAIIESGDFSINQKAQELNELTISGNPIRKNFQNRIRQYGGACNLWAGRSLIFNEIDLKNRSWINNSGWPISMEELNHYYSKLHKKYGMVDFDMFSNTHDDFDNSLYADIFKFDDFDSDKAVWTEKIARFGDKSKTFKRLNKSHNVVLFKNATVQKLCDIGSRINSCRVVSSKNNTLINIQANCFIIAAGGIENARILLSSRDQHSVGIGNKYDNVGRYYMDHPSHIRKNIKLNKRIYHSSLFQKPIKGGRFKNIIRFNDAFQEKHQLTNNHIEFSPQYPESYENAFSSTVQMAKILLRKGSGTASRFDFSQVKISKIPEIIYLLSPSEIIPHLINRLYYQANVAMNRPINSNNLVVSHHMEQVPNRDSRVSLIHTKNYLNINKTNLNWIVGSKERETADMLENKIIEVLKKSDWIDKDVEYKKIDAFNDASHHMGTTRISLSPKGGVVDHNCQVHNVDNLFIAGSSVFPTSGSANPTYTIAALTLRLSKYLRVKYA
jgi:hypothetical protein